MPLPLRKNTAKIDQIISLDCSTDLITPGSLVNGVVRVDTKLAERKGLREITVELVGEIRIAIDTAGGKDDWATIRQKKSIIQGDGIKMTVWKGSSDLVQDDSPKWNKLDKESSPPPSFQSAIAESSGMISFSFSLPFPTDPALPPSFCDNVYVSYAEGIVSSVQYFVQVKGLKNENPNHESNVTLVKPFVYLPYDDSPPPPVHGIAMRTWKGGSNPTKVAMFGEKKVGEVQVGLSVPSLPSFPLSQEIPISIEITCFSPYMSANESNNPSSFKFPLPPTTAQDLELKLFRRVVAVVGKMKHRMHRRIDLGPVAGFGKKESTGFKSLVHADVGAPEWIVREDNKKEGRWRQTVQFQSSLFFDCSPTFEHENLSIRYMLDLKVPFPGIGNNLELSATLPPITSGIIANIDIPDGFNKKLDLHPSYFERVPVDGFPTAWKQTLTLPG